MPSMLKRWITELGDFLNEPQSLPEDITPEDMERLFSSLLHHAARRIRVVVVLVDALNQFLRTERSEALTWLPALWPDNARFLATAISGPESRSLSRRPFIQTVQTPPLAAADVELIGASVYGRYHRTPNPEVLAVLRNKRLPDDTPSAGNPLWMCLALDLLNLLDADDFARAETEMTGTPEDKLRHLLLSRARALPETLDGIYGELIRQVEKLSGPGQTHAFCSLITLSRICQRHGFQFQAIDLRWGVSEEAVADQSTVKICRAEIACCQTVTPCPNFVVLLG